MPSGEVEALYSLSRASEITGRARATLEKWILEGRIPAIVVLVGSGNRRRFCIPQDVVRQLLANSPRSAA